MNSDFVELLAAFNAQSVEYLVVGADKKVIVRIRTIWIHNIGGVHQAFVADLDVQVIRYGTAKHIRQAQGIGY